MVIGIDTSRAFEEAKTGTENYSYHLVKAMLRLPESKLHDFVLFTRPNAIIPAEFKAKNVKIHSINYKYLWTQVGLAWQTWQTPRLDVLWIPAHTLPILRKPGIRTVVTIHGLEYRWLPEYRNWLQRWYLPLSTFYAAKSANQLIAVSKFTKNELQKEVQNISKNIKVIHEGVDSSMRYKVCSIGYRDKIDTLYGIQNTKYILFVGTIQPRKNLVALIAAFAHTDLEKLVIAGGVGWNSEEVMEAPSKFGVQEKVVFTGRVPEEELNGLYRGAAMYVQPSITEGFGLPVLEAMEAGVPVVASDGGALPEVVGRAGVIVPLGEDFVQKLESAMKALINDPREQKRLISMGYERVKEFGWDKASRATLNVLVG